MATVTIVYWRDMPAQAIAGKGRRAVKVPPSERFEKAIDRAAMASGAAGTDDYLAEWYKGAPYELPGDDATVVTTEAARLEAEYDMPRLRALIFNGGWAEGKTPEGKTTEDRTADATTNAGGNE